jgi:acyl-CoA reductase-like NAD-dependent aldehyde dehydrogenase
MATRGRPPASAGRNGASRAVAARAGAAALTAAPARVEVRKTYKLYIGGAFPRTESGRSYLVAAADGAPLANACRASRKDLREAVRAARKAFPGWAAKTAMNRGQVLYRVAELMEGRREQFATEVAAAEGLTPAASRDVVSRAIDRWVWYAGWADKIGQVLGSSNPVAAPYFNFTIPEPTGVVGVVAPETSSLLGLVSRLAPPLVTGNAVVLLASERRPLPAVTLAEVLATSDVPGGVVNILTGRRSELVPVLAAHADIDALDTWGVPDALRVEVEQSAAEDIKRLLRRPTRTSEARFDWLDDAAAERPEWIAAFLEMKTVWHPIGG